MALNSSQTPEGHRQHSKAREPTDIYRRLTKEYRQLQSRMNVKNVLNLFREFTARGTEIHNE